MNNSNGKKCVDKDAIVSTLSSLCEGTLGAGARPEADQLYFQNGMIATYNGMLACSAPSPFDPSLQGSTHAAKLLGLLRLMPDEIAVEYEKGQLLLQAGLISVQASIKQQVSFSIDQIEFPKDWRPLQPDFLAALEETKPLLAKKALSEWSLNCIHVTSEWLETANYCEALRWFGEMGTAGEFLVHNSVANTIAAIEPDEMAEGNRWIHFRNSAKQITLSAHRYDLAYPSLEKIFATQGDTLHLPENFGDAIERAKLFCDKAFLEGTLQIELRNGQMSVSGTGPLGRYLENFDVEHEGSPISFRISPGALASVLNRSYAGKCSIEPKRILVRGDAFIYVCAIMC